MQVLRSRTDRQEGTTETGEKQTKKNPEGRGGGDRREGGREEQHVKAEREGERTARMQGCKDAELTHLCTPGRG